MRTSLEKKYRCGCGVYNKIPMEQLTDWNKSIVVECKKCRTKSAIKHGQVVWIEQIKGVFDAIED